MSNTNKSDIIDKVAALTGSTKADASKAVDATFEAITTSLAAGNKVTLLGFGQFKVAERKAHVGRNPSTGAEIQVAAKKAVKFKGGKDLEARI